MQKALDNHICLRVIIGPLFLWQAFPLRADCSLSLSMPSFDAPSFRSLPAPALSILASLPPSFIAPSSSSPSPYAPRTSLHPYGCSTPSRCGSLLFPSPLGSLSWDNASSVLRFSPSATLPSSSQVNATVSLRSGCPLSDTDTTIIIPGLLVASDRRSCRIWPQATLAWPQVSFCHLLLTRSSRGARWLCQRLGLTWRSAIMTLGGQSARRGGRGVGEGGGAPLLYRLRVCFRLLPGPDPTPRTSSALCQP